MLANKIKKILLILDQARPHKSNALNTYLISRGIRRHFIPANLTGVLQPADTHWFSGMKTFKI